MITPIVKKLCETKLNPQKYLPTSRIVNSNHSSNENFKHRNLEQVRINATKIEKNTSE